MAAGSSFSYGEAAYWNERYRNEGPDVVFDWYQRYDALAPFLDHYLRKTDKIVMSGCGNAGLSRDMADAGYENIVNIDISKVLIDHLRGKNSHNQRLSYLVMDARHLQFEDCSVDAVVDKGTLDAIMCGANSTENSKMLLSEAARVLRPGGIYLLITYGDPRTRMCHLESPALPWSICLHVIPRPGEEFPLCEGRPLEENPQFLLKPVEIAGNKLLPSGISLDAGNVHFIYVCKKK